jgi:hypothetical protein
VKIRIVRRHARSTVRSSELKSDGDSIAFVGDATTMGAAYGTGAAKNDIAATGG